MRDHPGEDDAQLERELILDFIESMPAQYRGSQSRDAMLDHARLATSRQGAAVAVATFRSHHHEGLPVCVVADDRPGLLSLVSAALVASGLDVVRAEAYCRKTPAGVEAVDLFWLRAAGSVRHDTWIAPSDVVLFRTLLLVLLEGTLARGALLDHLRDRGRARGSSDVRVRMVLDDRQKLAAVDVETSDRPGLLFVLTDALAQQRVQIVRSEIRTIVGRAFDRFYILELDGSHVARQRESALASALQHALHPAFGPRVRMESSVQTR
jgi:[protein-PII] uridylyltransferase